MFSTVSSLLLSACNGGINLAVPASTNSVESSPILVEEPVPTPTPDPESTPTPSPSPSPSPTPNPNAKSRIFVSKAVVAVTKKNSRAVFESVCKKEAKKAKLKGNYTALVGMTNGVFSDQYKIEGRIYQVEKGVEIPVADSLQDLIDGKNNAIFVAACGARLDDTLNWGVWTGNNDFNKPSREDMNCKNWGDHHANGVIGWLGATGSSALAMEYRDCYEYAHIYCIEHQ